MSARRALDRQAADVLLAAGAAPVEVAAQIAASAEPGDEQAISILLRAGEALATTDPGAGADLSRRALELAPRDHILRGPLLAQSAVLLHSAGREHEARAFADTHLRDALPAEQEAEVLLAIAGMFRVPPDARVAAGRRALVLPDLPAHVRAHHLAALFHNLLVGGRTEEARAIHAEVAEAVQASGDANSAFAFALAESVTAYVDGRYDQALEMTEQAARAGIGTTDWAREHLAQEWRCETRTVVDQVDDSLRLAADSVAVAQRDRNGWAIRIFEIWRGRQLHQLGRLADAGATSKDSSARRPAIASSAPLMPPASSLSGESRYIRAMSACSNERLDSQEVFSRTARRTSAAKPHGSSRCRPWPPVIPRPRTHRCAPSARTSAPRSCRSSRST